MVYLFFCNALLVTHRHSVNSLASLHFVTSRLLLHDLLLKTNNLSTYQYMSLKKKIKMCRLIYKVLTFPNDRRQFKITSKLLFQEKIVVQYSCKANKSPTLVVKSCFRTFAINPDGSFILRKIFTV